MSIIPVSWFFQVEISDKNYSIKLSKCIKCICLKLNWLNKTLTKKILSVILQ